jgi:hypothetical protein
MDKFQKDLISEHLKKKKSITSWEAITLYRITRLAAIILELRKTMEIFSKNETANGKRFVRYQLIKVKKA